MKVRQYSWNQETGWDRDPFATEGTADLLLVFVGTELGTAGQLVSRLAERYGDALMIGCSTGGEICGTTVSDHRLVLTTIAFESSWVRGGSVFSPDYANGEEATRALLEQFPREDLMHLFLLSDGLMLNGSDIVRGIEAVLPPEISVSGGLAGDGMRFSASHVIFAGKPGRSTIAAVGFYGKQLEIGCGSAGGWIPFGPERLITGARGNILTELDGQSAVDLYRQYLGHPEGNLGAAGIHFPLSIRLEEEEEPIVRTMMYFDQENEALWFAGDVPAGCYARFMRAMPDDLIDGAERAARISKEGGGENPELCILISCIGRRAVLKQLTEEETEVVEECYARPPVMTGFYSYGEIAPFRPGGRIVLHNQTMTITTISERQ